MEENKAKKRIFEYDLMRVIFMLMVLGIHILSKVKTFSNEFNTTWYVVNICTNFFMICNPLFFLLSGKFNLNKEFNNLEDYKKYYKSKIITILIPFFIISIIIYVINNYSNLSIKDFLEKFISGSIEGTYWFIYNLIGIIIITPFLSKMVKNMNLLDKKIYFYFVIAITAFITIILALGKKTIINFATFGITSWIFYYLLGYFIEEVFRSYKSRKIIICIGILAFVLQLIIERFFKSAYRIYDPSPILTLEAVSLYFLILDYIRIKNEGIKKIILLIAKYSYIFYLFHNTIINYTFKFIKFNLNMSSKMNMAYGIIDYIIVFTITILCAILFTYVMNFVKKIISKLFIKIKSKYKKGEIQLN